MALIGKIRQKSWLLVAVIGIAMLAFILGDLDSVFNSSGREDQFGIGVVNGQQINEQEYNNVLQNARNQIFQNKMQQNNGQALPLDENDEKNAARQAWNAIVSESLLKKELEGLGLIVDDIELDNVLYGEDGFSPSPSISQAEIFLDSLTGEFNPNLVRRYFDNLETSPDPQAIEQLQNTIDYVRQYRREEKYNTLLSVGLHATSLEGEEEYIAQKEVKNISYVYQRFSKVSSDDVGEPLEDEIRAYYDKHKNLKKFNQKASRKINYFTISVTPGGEDTLKTMEFLTQLKPRFEKAKDDSNFVIRFSDIKEFTREPQANYPTSVANAIESGAIGTVVGPYEHMGQLAIAKIIDMAEVPSATVRHILLNANSPEEISIAEKRADSIIRVIRNKKNFEEMVQLFSDDPGSKNTGGKYEDFAEGMMVPEFNDFSFQKPIGTLGRVKTDFGIHIIEVLDRKSAKRPILATVTKSVEITKSSMDNANSLASSLIYDLDDLISGKTAEEKVEAFSSFATENGYTIRSLNIQDKSPEAQGFGSVAEGRLLRLAFEEGNKAGTLSSAPIRDNQRIIVAILAEINPDGVPEFNKVRDRMKAEVLKELQAKFIIDQMVGREDLENLATELDAQFESEGITFSANNTAVGREPIIVGTAFSGLIDGQQSVPVKGTNGVFALRIDGTVEAPETTDFSTEQAQLASQRRSTLLQRFRTELTESAEVIDNRKLRSYGIR